MEAVTTKWVVAVTLENGGCDESSDEKGFVLRKGSDQKREELFALPQNTPKIFSRGGVRRKLVLFLEHRDGL